MPSGNKLAGSYQLVNNKIVFERDLPPLEQANGRLEFTEGAVRVPGVTGVFLGGPIDGERRDAARCERAHGAPGPRQR